MYYSSGPSQPPSPASPADSAPASTESPTPAAKSALSMRSIIVPDVAVAVAPDSRGLRFPGSLGPVAGSLGRRVLTGTLVLVLLTRALSPCAIYTGHGQSHALSSRIIVCSERK